MVETNKIYQGDVLDVLRSWPDESVHCVVTSPPYWGLRDYGVAGQLGLESTPEEFVVKMVEVFREVRRVLRKDGTAFVNLGDSYFGGAQREGAYGRPGRERSDSQDRDCACRSLCDACRVAYQLGKAHSAGLPSPMQETSPSAPSRERMASEPGRLPTSDYDPREAQLGDATQDQPQTLGHVAGQPRASLASMPGESAQQPPDSHSVASSLAEGCLLCGRSLPHSARESERMAGCSCDSAAPAWAGRNQGKGVSVTAYQDYTTASLKPKDLVGIPWRVAFALQADGWYLRSDIIWSKPNPMPESVTDRPTKAHEYIFLLTKSAKYFYDAEAIKEPAIYREDERPFGNAGGNRHGDENRIFKPVYKDARSYDGKHSDKQRGHGRRHAGFNDRWDKMEKLEQCSAMRNKRSVWTIATSPFPEAHFATFPQALIEPCIRAGSPQGGVVLDPFMGAGTTALVSLKLGRQYLGIELNPEYITIAEDRIMRDSGLLQVMGAEKNLSA